MSSQQSLSCLSSGDVHQQLKLDSGGQTVSELKLWLMNRPFNSPLTAHVALAPNIQLNLRGLTRSQRSEVNYSMKYGQSLWEAKRCFSVYLKTKHNEEGGNDSKSEPVWWSWHSRNRSDLMTPSLAHWQMSYLWVTRACYLYETDGTFEWSGYLRKQTERQRKDVMIFKREIRPRPSVGAALLIRSELQTKGRTSFKACFIESHKKWSGWIVSLGNQLEEWGINLSPR